MLARAPQSESELRRRLVAKGYQEATAEATLTRCRELGWVNDAVFALDRARALRRRGAGALRIGGDLEARGVPEPLIVEAVDMSRDGRSEAALAREALGNAPEPASAPGRAWRLLMSRGFPEDVVMDVVGSPGDDD
jgi:regulatory protein